MRFWKLPKPIGIAIAGYELLALCFPSKIPTITQICKKYPPVGLLVIVWLIDHLIMNKEPV